MIREPDLLQHTWSLSVEAKFYLLWPLVFLVVRRQPVAALIGLYLVFTANRFLTTGWIDGYYRPDTHSTGLILGAMAAYAPWRSPTLGWIGAAMLAVALSLGKWGDRFTLEWMIMLAEFGSALLILGIIDQRGMIARALSVMPLRWMGLMSYGIYLWHYPIARLARETLDTWPAVFVTLAASTALASLSFYTFERIRRIAPRAAITS